MPHVIIKMYPGRTEGQKKDLATSITAVLIDIAKAKESSISIAIEEVLPEQWPEKVYKPDILEKQDNLYKKPGYDPFAC